MINRIIGEKSIYGVDWNLIFFPLMFIAHIQYPSTQKYICKPTKALRINNIYSNNVPI